MAVCALCAQDYLQLQQRGNNNNKQFDAQDPQKEEAGGATRDCMVSVCRSNHLATSSSCLDYEDICVSEKVSMKHV